MTKKNFNLNEAQWHEGAHPQTVEQAVNMLKRQSSHPFFAAWCAHEAAKGNVQPKKKGGAR